MTGNSYISIGMYYYHGDHLGSATYVTDYAGDPVQFITYRPYGQLDVNQHTSYDERYKFTGKERDEESGYDYFGARYYGSVFPLWLSVDPLSNKYPDISPYAYCNWNPVIYVDLEGKSYSDFDEEGRYLGTSHDNWFHNTFCGQTGRVLDSRGNVIFHFKFADPQNDVADLKSGKLKYLQFVSETDITGMLYLAGAFDVDNNTSSKSLNDRYQYILTEGKGFGKLDFAQKAKNGLGSIYGDNTYNSLYLVDGIAHNPSNFGNFLFGASGISLGYLPIELLIGAHINSLFNSATNGYESQFDSFDDQKSIIYGIRHALSNNYKKSK